METKYERNGHTIKDLATGERKPHKSVNAAKKWSREFQIKNGGLGCGSVRVAK